MQLSQRATKLRTFNFLLGENSCPELSRIWERITPPITTSNTMRKTKTDSRYLLCYLLLFNSFSLLVWGVAHLVHKLCAKKGSKAA